MSYIQRATIIVLVFAALAVWGLGLRAALRPVARADQEPTATPGVTDTPTETMTVTPASLAAIPPSTLGAVLKIPTPTATATSSPTATASRTATPSPSPSATATRQPSPSRSPTATTAATATATANATATATANATANATATATTNTAATAAATRWAHTFIPTPYVAGTPTIPQAGRFLFVDQDEQLMRVYEDGIEIRTIPVSSGRPIENAFTPAWRGDVGRYWGGGPFLNTDMWSDYMWYLFPGARGSILIHSVPYTWENDLKIYDRPDALGVEPASHGCVRISTEDAQWLKGWDPVGVPIDITPWSGEIGPPDESL